MTEPREIHIHAGDEPVISAALAAKRYGVSNATMRSTLSRLRVAGVIEPVPEMLDDRTPLYPLDGLELAMGTRPGKGANLRKTDNRPMAELTAAMQPAYGAALSQIGASNWPEDVTERAAREVASELWRTRKEAGTGWKRLLRELIADTDQRRRFSGGLMGSLRSQGATAVTPAPIDRAVLFAARAMVGD